MTVSLIPDTIQTPMEVYFDIVNRDNDTDKIHLLTHAGRR